MDTRPGAGVPDPAAPRPSAPSTGTERPLGDLFRALSRDAGALVRQELALARAELRRNVRAAARDTVLVALGGSTALLGLLVLLAALVVGVGDALGDRHALGALIVGAVLLVLGAGLAATGWKQAKRTPLAPAGSLAALRDTGHWARGEVSGLRAALAGSNGRTTGHGRISGERIDDEPTNDGWMNDGRIEGGWIDGGRIDDRGRIGPPSPPRPAVDPPADPRTKQRARAGADSRASLPASAPLWKRVAREFKADDVSSQAARVAYYFFLSLPPALMALFGLTGLFGGRETGDWLTQRLTATLPPEASALVTGFVSDIVHRDAPGPLSVGLLLALWAGSSVFTALEHTLNAAFGITARRSFVRRRLLSVGMLGACALLFLAGSAVLLGGKAISDALGLGEAGRAAWGLLQVPLGLALITATFWLIYYVLPNRDQRGCRGTLLKASALAGVLFVLASLAFRFYMARFGSHSATYGLLGGVIVLLLWMYVTSAVILLGGEIASEMERTA